MDVLPHLTLLNFSSQAWTLDTVNSVYLNISGTAKPFFLFILLTVENLGQSWSLSC